MDRSYRAFMRKLGRRLKELREERELTQEAVAERADLESGQFVSDVEGGRRGLSLPTLRKLVEKGLGATLREVFEGIEDERTEERSGERVAVYRAAELRRRIEILAREIEELPADVRSEVVPVIRQVIRLVKSAREAE